MFMIRVAEPLSIGRSRMLGEVHMFKFLTIDFHTHVSNICPASCNERGAEDKSKGKILSLDTLLSVYYC